MNSIEFTPVLPQHKKKLIEALNPLLQWDLNVWHSYGDDGAVTIDDEDCTKTINTMFKEAQVKLLVINDDMDAVLDVAGDIIPVYVTSQSGLVVQPHRVGKLKAALMAAKLLWQTRPTISVRFEKGESSKAIPDEIKSFVSGIGGETVGFGYGFKEPDGSFTNAESFWQLRSGHEPMASGGGCCSSTSTRNQSVSPMC